MVVRHVHNCFLTHDDEVLHNAHKLASIPGVLIQGRRDISGPAITPWLLRNAWPGSQLTIVETEGHGGPTEMELTAGAIEGFATKAAL